MGLITWVIGVFYYWTYETLFALICLDVFFGTLCMALSLSVNSKYYHRLCFCSVFNCYFCNAEIEEEVNIVAISPSMPAQHLQMNEYSNQSGQAHSVINPSYNQSTNSQIPVD